MVGFSKVSGRVSLLYKIKISEIDILSYRIKVSEIGISIIINGIYKFKCLEIQGILFLMNQLTFACIIVILM